MSTVCIFARIALVAAGTVAPYEVGKIPTLPARKSAPQVVPASEYVAFDSAPSFQSCR